MNSLHSTAAPDFGAPESASTGLIRTVLLGAALAGVLGAAVLSFLPEQATTVQPARHLRPQARPADLQTAAYPAFVRPQARTLPAGPREYTVQQGDSLPGIAYRFYGTTAAYTRLIDANPALQTQAFRAGITLVIPDTD